MTADELHHLETIYPVLAQLDASQHAALRADLRRVDAAAGAVLFDLGSACSLFLFLSAGSIRVVKPAPSGREIALYRLQPGDNCILTVSCLLGYGTYPARGIVDSRLTAYGLSEAVFQRLIEQSRPFRIFVFRYFADRIADLMQLVEEVAFGPVDQRLALLLVQRGPVFSGTHQLLADELGTVREVVSRHLKQFEAQGLVHLQRGQVQILDPQRLAQRAGALRDSGH